jgi:membrane peptidoglycan carboxypeptidase
VLVALSLLGYFGFEQIIEFADSRYPNRSTNIWASTRRRSRVCTTRDTLPNNRSCFRGSQNGRVHFDPRASNPHCRSRGHPPLFTGAILASEDKNFFTHEGVDKVAIVRAMAKRLLQESRSGASTLTMQIAKHLRHGTGRASTEMEKLGDIVMALRIEREFSRPELLLRYVNLPLFRPRAIRCRRRPAGPISESRRRNSRFIKWLLSWRSSTGRRFPTVRLRRTRC